MSTSRRHHYVPQFYLRAFTVPHPEYGEGFWVYDKHDQSGPRFQTPVNTAVKGHFYSFESDGQRRDDVERLLANIEAAATPILARWQKPGERPTGDEVSSIVGFLAFMHTRVPRSLEAAREIEKTLSLEILKDLAGRPDLSAELERFKNETGNDPFTPEAFVELVQHFDEHFKLEIGDRHPLSVSLRITPAVVEQLLTMKWCICDAPSNTFFVTGDCPMNIFAPVGRGQAIFGGGLARQEAQVTFPLSPTACLLLDRRGGALRRRVGEPFVREVNRRTAFAAERFVISTYATKRVAECVRQGAASVGRPKTDEQVLIPRLRKAIAASRRTAVPDAPRPVRADHSGPETQSGP